MKNNKKKVAFVLTSFVVGGVEKAFLDMLSCIDQNKYDITVFLPDAAGNWTQRLEELCSVKYIKNETFGSVFSQQLRKLQFFDFFRSLFYRILAKLYYQRNYRKSTEFFIKSMPRVKEKFDCAIAYQIINDDCVLSTLYRIRAKKKAVWSHAYIKKDEPIYGYWYNKFDSIFCVSRYAKFAFLANFPNLESKTEIIHNIIDSKKIAVLAQAPLLLPERNQSPMILTVGRLSKDKNQIIIPETAQILKNNGYQFQWFLVGEGQSRDEIIERIHDNNTQAEVILVGNQDNPYPYMQACDIYVQTSLTEGWGITVTEAKILAKPIITTEAGVMSEQILNGVNGIIAAEATAESLAYEIARLLDNPALCQSFVQQLQKENNYCSNELQTLYTFIEKRKCESKE